MIFLDPYSNPRYFILIAIAVIPAIILQLLEKRCEWYRVLLTIFFLYVSFGGPNMKQGFALLGYILFQILLAAGYAAYRSRHNHTGVFLLTVVLSVLPLLLIKLTGIVPAGMAGKLSALGFLGVSYLTFRSVQFIIEMRDGLVETFGLWSYVRFLTFWPTISAGPIDRYRRFERERISPPDRGRYVELLGCGVWHIFVGFLYNYIIGYVLGRFLLPVVTEHALTEHSVVLGTLIYMYVYSTYLFFDFAGYSRMAIGVSYLLGHETPPNFNLPFLSTNIKDFWNRWHMSLSFWFRDYVYMRLLMAFMKKKVFQSRIVMSNVSYFALFLLMGAWHGFTWYYIAYGLYHAALICLTDAWIRFKKKHADRIPSNRFTKVFSVVLTVHAVCFSFLIFSGFIDTLVRHFA
jgi:membrane protein involved in D-alanine export